MDLKVFISYVTEVSVHDVTHSVLPSLKRNKNTVRKICQYLLFKLFYKYGYYSLKKETLSVLT